MQPDVDFQAHVRDSRAWSHLLEIQVQLVRFSSKTMSPWSETFIS